jgi:hypothetical protein
LRGWLVSWWLLLGPCWTNATVDELGWWR